MRFTVLKWDYLGAYLKTSTQADGKHDIKLRSNKIKFIITWCFLLSTAFPSLSLSKMHDILIRVEIDLPLFILNLFSNFLGSILLDWWRSHSLIGVQKRITILHPHRRHLKFIIDHIRKLLIRKFTSITKYIHINLNTKFHTQFS